MHRTYYSKTFFVQTHVSENPAECEVAVSMHEGCKNYVDIYAQANLLTEKVIDICRKQFLRLLCNKFVY